MIRLDDFSVAFAPPRAGFIRFDLQAGRRRVTEWFSNTYPSLATLCAALAEVMSEQPARVTRLLLEPEELELALADCPFGGVRIELRHFRCAVQRQPNLLLSHTAPRRVVVLEFWRALHRLQSSLPDDAFAHEWGSRFPARELDAVASLITARRLAS